MTQTIINEILAFCEANADPALVVKYSRYFSEGYNAWGVDGKKMEEHRKLLLEKYAVNEGFAGFLKVSDRLILHEKYEAKSYALQLAIAFKKEWKPAHLDHFGRWFDEGITNWGHTDFFCSEALPLFEGIGVDLIDKFREWAVAPSRWKRRAAVVSLIKPMKKGMPVAKILDLANILMEDGERTVQQGVGWLLRECWKKHPSPVEAFLLKWRETSPRLIFQYATEKMSAVQKDNFRRSNASKKKAAGSI